MVPSSTQSARCSGDISLEIPGQASARPTSSEIGSLVLVCSAIMPFTKSRAVCSSKLERMATELRQKSGSTARPAAELAVRHRHVIAHCPLSTCPRIELACSRERAFCAPWAQRAGHPRLTAAFCWFLSVRPSDAYLRRDRLTIHDGLQRSADQTDPSPPEPHRRPSQSPRRH